MNSEEKCFLENLPPIYYLLEEAIRQESTFENYLHFYDKEDIYERNVTFEVGIYAKDYIAFADDNGDAVFLISKYDNNIYMSDLGDLINIGLKSGISSGEKPLRLRRTKNGH